MTILLNTSIHSKSQQAEQDWQNFALAVAVVGAATATDGDGACGDLDCHDMTWVCNLLYVHHMMDCYFNILSRAEQMAHHSWLKQWCLDW